MKACVIGHPIAHSKSPIIHQYWLEKYNINGEYNAIDIHNDNLKDGIKQLIDVGYNGFNVTLPHKQAMLEICDSLDGGAKSMGAVNTVVIQDEKLLGRNTDAFGFIQNIKDTKPEFDFKNKTALILGAGGATRAVIHGLLQEGVASILVSNRTYENAHALEKMNDNVIRAVEWSTRAQSLDGVDLLVNTTSLGMQGKPELEIDLAALSSSTLVADIVYTPLNTALLIEAKNRGNAIVNGIGMLLHQARPAFEAWTGILPDVTQELKEKVLA